MKRPSLELLNLALWATVDPKALPVAVRKRFRQRIKAIELYARGVPVDEIERKSALDRRSLYRAIERALRTHPDGRLWGFRALVPQSRTQGYRRYKRMPRANRANRGLAGAFGQLLERHHDLERLVRQMIQDREVWLTQLGDTFYLQGLKAAHGRFLRACRAQGLDAADYPLNQEEEGKRSLGRTLRQRMLDGFAQAARSAGAGRVKPAAALAVLPEAPVIEPYDTVELDAHKLDVRLTILDQDPYRQEQVIEIERAWLLAIIDVASRAILGYSLCLRREYSRFEVIRTFEQALAPATPPKISIPGIVPLESGGFVSVALPETAYACWGRIRFDNARAHLAADSLDVACEVLGCIVDVGPVYEPDDRPFIERFFGTVATQLIHRLPGTTGSKPRDPLRELRSPGGDLRLVVGLDELQQLLAVWVWNYNGTPHGGLGGRTPLEAVSAAVRERRLLLRHLPESMRGNLCLLQTAHRSRVRGNITRGDKPHISFYHVRYTSAALAQRPDLIGKTLRVYYDADDIRSLRAFLPDGSELGELKAGGLWSLSPHSLEMRQRIFKAKRLRQVRFNEGDDPVQIYLQFKRSQAKRSRKAASEIAQIKQLRDSNPVKTSGNTEKESSLPLAVGPVAPRRLRIPPGFA